MDQITDVGWFYSSLAQSAASIVGIVGAVFLTRLMDHRERMREERQHLFDNLGAFGRSFAAQAGNYTDAAFLVEQQSTPADKQALGDGAAALRLLTGRVEPRGMAAIERRLAECERRAPSSWAKGHLHRNAEHVGLLRRNVETFRDRALPRALIAVWGLLAWLSVFGVIWPLAVLPALPQTVVSKGLVLTFFGLGVFGFVVYLAYELWQLRQLGQFDWVGR